MGERPGNYDSGLYLLVGEPQNNQKIVERKYTTKDGLPAHWITDAYSNAAADTDTNSDPGHAGTRTVVSIVCPSTAAPGIALKLPWQESVFWIEENEAQGAISATIELASDVCR